MDIKMKEMITNKLTEFVFECEDDNSLTQFLNVAYNARLAHSTKDIEGNKKVFVVFNNNESKVYSPEELIKELLIDETRVDKIRPIVHHIKDNVDYKQRINYFK